MTVAEGRDILSGAPASVSVNSSHIYDYIVTYLDKILEYASFVMSKLDAEVASGIMHSGIYLSGGLMKMDGIAEYINNKLGILVNTADEPQLASVIGAGAILSNDYLFERFATD